MTIPRISSLLIMLIVGHDALALQMGQMISESTRGQPLTARVSLYGAAPVDAGELRAELLPAFGAPLDSLSRLGLSARIETDGNGVQMIVVTSERAIDAASLGLRVRLHEGARAMLRHYELNVPAASAPRVANTTRPSRPSKTSRTVPSFTSRSDDAAQARPSAWSGNYGPVRAGQSLWGILKETGLARGDNHALMSEIVAANPRAFVDADATRLRLGATLQLPIAARAGSAIAPSDADISPPARTQAVDAETAARLQQLAVKFAEIRARYAQQHARTTANTAPTPPAAKTDLPLVSADADSALPAPATTIKTAQPSPKAVAIPQLPNSDTLLGTVEKYIDGKILIGLGVSLLLVALLTIGVRVGRRLRSRQADAGVRSADRELVAEIARKAEKRVQLEGEVKRMIAGRREGADEAAPGVLRPADLLASAGARASLEDIETRIAHGQYNEAEAMLEQTIAETPNNYRAKLRLAEIYYLNERHEEFVDLADEIYRKHRSDIGDDNWARLMRMGKVIAPDRPPFSGPVAVEAGRRAH